jgi:predicted ribonuclease YlaK
LFNKWNSKNNERWYKKILETLKGISNKIEKIPLLGKDINLGKIINESLWPKIFDYSNGIFFNYTKYFKGIKNLKIDISEIKYFLIEKEEQLSTILDDEYFILLK